MKEMMGAIVLACAVGSTASAGILSGSSKVERIGLGGSPDALGSLVNAGNAGFISDGGAILNSIDNHTLGTSEPMTNALDRASTITSTVTTEGNLRTITVTWITDNGGAMLLPGDRLNQQPIIGLSFELGRQNFDAGGIFDPMFRGFDHEEDAEDPGEFLAEFTLLDTSGGTIISTNWFVNFDAATDSIGGFVIITAGGQNLGNFGIGGGTATVRYFIPTPGPAALFVLAGFAASSRRRGNNR